MTDSNKIRRGELIFRLCNCTTAMLAALTLALILLPQQATAEAGDGVRPHCEVCRRFTDVSPSRIEVMFDFDNHQVVKQVCSVFCYLELMEDYEDHKPELVRMVNHATLDSEMQLWVILDRATFVLLEDGNIEKCSEPFAYAFQLESDAESAAENLDGEIISWEELQEMILELTEEYEPEKPAYRYSSNKRRPK